MICLTFCIPTCTKAFGKSNFIYCIPVIYFAFELGQVVLFLGTTPGEAEFWMLALVQQLIALVKNTGVLDKAKEKVKQCLGKQALDEERVREAASKRVIKAALDNFGELVTPIVLGIALAAETLYTAVGGKETFYDQGVFRHWRQGVSVSMTYLVLFLVVILRCLFMYLEVALAEYLSKKNSHAQVQPEVKPEDTSDKPRKEMSATEEWKAVFSKIRNGTTFGKVMILVGVLVNVILVVTESAWYAYFAVLKEEEQDD